MQRNEAISFRQRGPQRSRIPFHAAMARIFLLGCLVFFMHPLRAMAQQPAWTIQEKDYKAAFIFHAARETVWPMYAFQAPETPLRIGILGSEKLQEKLEHLLADRTIHARRVEILTLASNEPVPDSLHILFIDGKLRSKRHFYLDSLKSQPILTISDMKDFTRCGGMIGLQLKKEKRVAINIHAVQQAGLHIADEFIRLAEITTGISPDYLYNIANLTTFPAHVMHNPDSVFTIGILGRSPFCKQGHKMLQLGRIHQMRIKLVVTGRLQKVLRCNLVYISQSEQEKYRDYLPKLHKKQILTVSEIPQFAYNGGFVQFNIRDRRTPLTLNQAAAYAGLEFHPKLLEIARVVIATVTQEND